MELDIIRELKEDDIIKKQMKQHYRGWQTYLYGKNPKKRKKTFIKAVKLSKLSPEDFLKLEIEEFEYRMAFAYRDHCGNYT